MKAQPFTDDARESLEMVIAVYFTSRGLTVSAARREAAFIVDMLEKSGCRLGRKRRAPSSPETNR